MDSGVEFDLGHRDRHVLDVVVLARDRELDPAITPDPEIDVVAQAVPVVGPGPEQMRRLRRRPVAGAEHLGGRPAQVLLDIAPVQRARGQAAGPGPLLEDVRVRSMIMGGSLKLGSRATLAILAAHVHLRAGRAGDFRNPFSPAVRAARSRNAAMQHRSWCRPPPASHRTVTDKMGCHSYEWRCAMLDYVRDWLSRWRVFRELRNELLQHNHRELYDLGIGPGDIDKIAWRGAWDAIPDPAR